MNLIPEFLAGIQYLLRRAEDMKIRERLVVVLQSEMGRTPNYNSGNGKDHWSIGSILFLGRNIKGNRVIGATDRTASMPITRPYSPGDVLATIYQHMGIDTHQMLQDRTGRPLPVLPEGKAIAELF